jgi:heme/copper-type cytochrome/quinol oxidase subunit 1
MDGRMALVPTPQQRLSGWALILATGGFVLLVVGIGITVWQWTHPVEFGWFAYAPLGDTVFNPTLNPTRPLVLGYCLSVLGALGLGAGTSIYVIVRRRLR